MAAPAPIPFVSTVSEEPTLQDVLNLERRRIKSELNCHAVATIIAFDPLTQTATAQIAYQQVFFQVVVPESPTIQPGPGTVSTQYAPYMVPYATIVQAPVVTPGGGGPTGAILSMPILPGDECLVCFSDRDISNWQTTGTPAGFPNTPRLHSFSDAIIVIGMRSIPRAVPNYDLTFAGIRDFPGTSSVGVDLVTHLIRIMTPGGTLGTEMQTLIASLSTYATAGAAAAAALVAASTGPLAPLAPGFTALEAAYTALITALATSATGFATVIE